MFVKIAVAVDGSDHAAAAVRLAADVARTYGAKLVVLHVMRHLGSDRIPRGLQRLEQMEHIKVSEADMLRTVAAEIATEARDLAMSIGAGDVETAVEDGDPAARIVTYCQENAVDLIVLGRRGLGQFPGMIVGSVSQKVSNAVPCPCLLT
jgi:nucleotide-binding universal stress UspA family protein